MDGFKLEMVVAEASDGTWYFQLRRASDYGADDPVMISTDRFGTQDEAHIAALQLIHWVRSPAESAGLHDVTIHSSDPEDGGS